VEIVSLNYGERFGAPMVPPPDLVRTTLVPCTSPAQRRMQWSTQFTDALRDRCRATGAQVLHDNGVWLPTNHATARVATESGLKRMVSPRGMLTGWALKHKGLRKRLAWWAYQRRDLERAQVLHATSRDEADGFRAVGLGQPIAIIPNGVELPPIGPEPSTLPSSEALRMVDSPQPSKRTVLFLGRIHPIKGLSDLVKAWAMVRPPGWRVVIAGDGDKNHQAQLEAEIRERGLSGEFSFVGPVTGDSKWVWYREAALFVLPSHSENFGIVVAEALACGVPVITTRGTPWEDLNAHRCGWWTDIGPEALAKALREATTQPVAGRVEMGTRGKRLVEEKYTWPGIAAQMHRVYSWMLGQAPKPDCIV
jgi:glycosyltransferase involved in cell wall biosynthesis